MNTQQQPNQDRLADNLGEERRSELSDHSQFVSHFARDSHRIFGFIFSLLPNHTDAEDVFQQTSLILWREFSKFDQERDFAAWACGIAFNTVRNFQRTSGRSRVTFNMELTAKLAEERKASLASSGERIDALDDCLRKLPAEDRELVQQAYAGDTSIKELAETLGRAVQTLYNRLNRIRRSLVECVDQTRAVTGGGE